MNTNDAIKILKDNGLKYTKKREDMINILLKKINTLMQNIFNKIRQRLSRYLSFDTIYRNLHLFKDLKIIESTELDGEMKFRIACMNIITIITLFVKIVVILKSLIFAQLIK